MGLVQRGEGGGGKQRDGVSFSRLLGLEDKLICMFPDLPFVHTDSYSNPDNLLAKISAKTNNFLHPIPLSIISYLVAPSNFVFEFFLMGWSLLPNALRPF